MTNSEAMLELKESGMYGNQVHQETIELAIQAFEENTKLKAEIEQLKQRLEIKDNNFELYSDALDEIEQLKATISKMETTTAQEDDLK